jgi:hypothetical protein
VTSSNSFQNPYNPSGWLSLALREYGSNNFPRNSSTHRNFSHCYLSYCQKYLHPSSSIRRPFVLPSFKPPVSFMSANRNVLKEIHPVLAVNQLGPYPLRGKRQPAQAYARGDSGRLTWSQHLLVREVQQGSNTWKCFPESF